jgi:hypothetical protein
MRRRTLFATLCAGYVVFLLATAPAWIAAEAIATSSAAQFNTVEGSVWNGAAALRIHDVALERIAWRFQPQRLFLGEWAYALRIDDAIGNGEAIVARGFSGWRIHDLNALLHAPAAARAAARFIPLAAAAAPEGKIRITAGDIALDARHAAGQIGAQWQDAALAFSDIRPLGDYQADIVLQGDGATFSIKTLKGVLRVAGRGSFQPPQQWIFNGEATAAPDMLPHLQALLTMLGTPGDRGVTVMRYSNVPR